MQNKSIIFFGTPDIACQMLSSIIKLGINVKAIVTKPDSLVGRKKQIYQSPVKLFALQHNITVLQPTVLNESFANELKQINADLYFVCAYGKIIPEKILNIPNQKCINLHTSLLPRWRGGAPIHWALISGDNITGVSLMYMDKTLDTGDTIYQETIQIDQDETYVSLHEKICKVGQEIINKKLLSLFEPLSTIKAKKQDNAKATYAPNIERKDEFIDWNKSSYLIYRLINGLFNVPVASTIYNNNTTIKVYKARLTNEKSNQLPGTIVAINKQGIQIATIDNDIILFQIQLPNKTPIDVANMINGNHPFQVNKKFNNYK